MSQPASRHLLEYAVSSEKETIEEAVAQLVYLDADGAPVNELPNMATPN
jgi:hypothetical protein